MPVYCVSYDLRGVNRDYTPLFEALQTNVDSWWHFLESTWLISTNESALQVWERLRRTILRDDSLLIIEVRHNLNGWLPPEAWQWIRANVH